MDTYDPTIPWYRKVCGDGVMAAEVFVYVDNLRVMGSSQAEYWLAAHAIAQPLGYLSIQDAAQKCQPPRQDVVAWAGLVVHTNHSAVVILTTKEK